MTSIALEPSATPLPAPTGYAVTIAPGLKPMWTADAAAAAAFNFAKIDEAQAGSELVPTQIISVEAMSGKDVPTAISGPYDELPVAWVVRAQGTFFYDRGPERFHGFFTGHWYIFNDAGVPVGFAYEHPYPTPPAS